MVTPAFWWWQSLEPLEENVECVCRGVEGHEESNLEVWTAKQMPGKHARFSWVRGRK